MQMSHSRQQHWGVLRTRPGLSRVPGALLSHHTIRMNARHQGMGLVLLLVLCAFQLVRADNSFPPIFTMSLNMPGLPENASNTMTVAWDSLNNRAAIWNTQQLAPGTVLFDVSVAPPPSGDDRIVYMGFNSVAGNHSTKQCCYHNITAEPLHPFWANTGPVVNATSCFGYSGLTCYAGTKARYAPSSVATWCFDANNNPICTVTLNSPYQPLWLVMSLTPTPPSASWFAFPNVFGSCDNNCDAP